MGKVDLSSLMGVIGDVSFIAGFVKYGEHREHPLCRAYVLLRPLVLWDGVGQPMAIFGAKAGPESPELLGASSDSSNHRWAWARMSKTPAPKRAKGTAGIAPDDIAGLHQLMRNR